MSLTLLSEAEIKNFVDGLDLGAGTEAARTLAALLLLSPAPFARAISALAAGLITFQNIRALPAINARLVDSLINARLGESDPAVMAMRYRDEWIPTSIDVPALRADSVGSPTELLASRFDTRWDYTVRPRYDFTRADETAFHTYSEAYAAYMVSANSEQGLAAVASFQAAHASFLADHPVFAGSTDPVLRLVERSLTEPLFLERRGGGIVADPLLDYVLSAAYRNVPPGDFRAFMETTYTAMAASDDPGRTGIPGARAIASGHGWSPDVLEDPRRNFATVRMARAHLPRAYGAAVSSPASLALDAAKEAAVVGYLEAARDAILAVRETVSVQLARSGAIFRAAPGSALGLLLLFTVS